jgi:hypothetical protein
MWTRSAAGDGVLDSRCSATDILLNLAMSIFSKPRDGGEPPGAPKDSQALPSTPKKVPPPLPAQARATSAVPVPPASRTVVKGSAPAAPARARPVMPDINIGPPPQSPDPIPEAAPVPGPAASAARSSAKIEARPQVAPEAAWPSMPPEEGDDDMQVSIATTFERLLRVDDLDLDLASLDPKAKKEPTAGALAASDLHEVRGLFAQLAANHVRQVRDFMIDLRMTDATVDWIEVCEPALRSLRRAADKLELTDLCAALDAFCGALSGHRAAGSRTVEGESRRMLLARYEELSALMPQAFALDLDAGQREAAITQSLLLQVPEVKKVTIDRLYAAGLATLQAFFLATPGDVAAAAGIAEPLAARIVERFRAYRDQVRGSMPDATRATEREQLAQLIARLRTEHDEHERVAESWTDEAKLRKRELRDARARTVLEIQLVLARLGEVEWLREIERLPFERKLVRLEAFLCEARDKYAQQS